MPFRSEAQRRYLYAQHPEIARRFQAETPANANLPPHAGRRKVGVGKDGKKVGVRKK